MQATRTRLELVRAHLTLGDTSAAKDLLIEAGQLLRGGCDFGSLQEDAGELSAAVPQPADLISAHAEAETLRQAVLRHRSTAG